MTIQNIYQYIDYKGITVTEFSKATGVSNGYFAKQRSANGAVSSHIIEKIVSIYGDINAEWLITGKGEMLKRNKDQKVATISQESASELSLQAREKLIPYYDVDFAAGAVEMYNDPSQVSYYLDVPEFTGCTAFKVYGDSMYPKIANGTMVFAKKLDQWNEHIEYGRIYGVVCRDGRKFIKYIRKNKQDPKNSFLLTSENEIYDDFEIKLSKIHNVWMIHGWVVKVV